MGEEWGSVLGCGGGEVSGMWGSMGRSVEKCMG